MRPLRNGFRGALTVAALALPLVLSACGDKSATPAGGGGRAGAPSPTATGPAQPAERWAPEPGFTRDAFSNPTTIDNTWFPLRPGTQYIYEGQTVEDGERTPHRVVFTVTDLTKVVDGVRSVVVWDRDYTAGVLTEAELAFFAQADDGNVWHFGQYPEEYEDGKVVGAPAWISGVQGAQAGITIKADPKPGSPSYSQGWGPEVDWTDRARVHQVGQRTCVRAGCYDNVLVTDETSREEPNAHQYKYYAPGVGNVRVGFGGADPTQETLELVTVKRLDAQALAQARAEALKLEKSAYATSKDVYGATSPCQPAPVAKPVRMATHHAGRRVLPSASKTAPGGRACTSGAAQVRSSGRHASDSRAPLTDSASAARGPHGPPPCARSTGAVRR
ncbi:MAG TPA: hypothetical protein VKP64_03870 [Mycobacteriales bacterium]|nr:hypothetical protein [Mycobacteriales bacterium]